MKIEKVNYDVNGRFPQCFNCLAYYPDMERMVRFGYDDDSHICFDCVEKMYNLFIENMSVEEFSDYFNSILDIMKECGIE